MPMSKAMRSQLAAFQEDTKREFVRSATIKEYWENGGHRFKVPPVQHDGPEWEIKQYEVMPNDVTFLRAMFQGRYTAPGTYTQLIQKNPKLIMMTDSPAEIWDHREPYVKAKQMEAKTVLVVGLGLGVVTRMLMSLPHIQRIDVLEKSEELINFFYGTFDDRVILHHGDVFKKRWPVKVKWDIVWIDIWPFISEDNEKEMNKINKKYWNRCRWIGYWSKHELMYQRAKTNEWKERAANASK